MKIIKSTIETTDLVYNFLSSADYKEAFECEFFSNKETTPDDLMIDFWTDNPSWINALFKIRNILVRPLGLRHPDDTEDKKKESLKHSIKEGKEYEIMSIPAKSDKETVMCLTDSHLTAYIAVYYDKNQNATKLKVSTLVQFHKFFGRIYFYMISPFHYFIVKSKIKQAVKKLE
ncbi:MAG: DUF2867 domain-containing protein [Prevotella sp.]|jgi:hypothetical protein|nr:DUF2867 domain-containing protein [Prevotella sp.]